MVKWYNQFRLVIIELHDDYKLVDLSKDIAPFGFTLTIPSKTNGLLNIFAGRTLENQHWILSISNQMTFGPFSRSKS